ncbi:MAG: CcmD family protein [Thermodesulfobacteriota bacterium]
MGNQTYLLAANIAVWLGLCGYVAFVAARQKNLDRRLKQLETLKDD